MKLDSIKDLEKVIKLCRRLGVNAIKVDGVEFQLSDTPVEKAKVINKITTQPDSYSPGITEDMKIAIDELTEEQLLMWSAEGNQQ